MPAKKKALQGEDRQDSHLRLKRRAPEEEEKGGADKRAEWHGGTGGRVESVGACLRKRRNLQ